MAEIKYKYESSNNIEFITREFIGKVIVDDLIQSFQYLIDKKLSNKLYKGIITDLRYAVLSLSATDFERLMIFVKENEVLGNLKLAVLVDTPEKIVFPTMASYKFKLNVRPYTTREAAVEWIVSGLS